MSAYSHTTHEVYCNGHKPAPTPEDPDNWRPCMKTYQPPEDAGDKNLTPAVQRKLAAKDGWTHVRSPLGRLFDKDFCPDHKPQGGDRG
jgi:hypothetical protein